jgi:hypothetical protein
MNKADEAAKPASIEEALEKVSKKQEEELYTTLLDAAIKASKKGTK